MHQVLSQIESYDNLIPFMVDALKSCTDLSNDVMSYCIINQVQILSWKIPSKELFVKNVLQGIVLSVFIFSFLRYSCWYETCLHFIFMSIIMLFFFILLFASYVFRCYPYLLFHSLSLSFYFCVIHSSSINLYSFSYIYIMISLSVNFLFIHSFIY